MTLANLFAFSSVFITTAIETTHTASLRFRAENAHRLPRSQKDWFFYHRSRSYAAMHAAVVRGVKRGVGMCGYVSLFLGVENAVDVARGRVDFAGSLLAGGVAGAWFGVVRKLPMSTTALMVRNGLWYGLLYGAAQDVVVALKGEPVAWIDPFVGRVRARRRGLDPAGSLQEYDR
ncbi:hypothetical protein DRE_01478 [Drechslerella stenobrocha 248]|uniref:Uncharacterized protein n=1 Tax=Drechslerella stenobrocha 248 TaxID=1043628 RepID=W7HI97_9PEZI|nr:hypothetical protein DRE_01478 [Drechslerella stenobrocha 248]